MSFPFKEIWTSRVRRRVTELDQAPWLEGIPELDVDVIELGEGSASEQNLIHIPLDNFDVDVLINNSSYPIAIQDYDDDAAVVSLDKYQTKATSISDDAIIGASYDKIDNATRSHVEAILKAKFARAIHALAPNVESAQTPIALTTGGSGARKILTYKDLVDFKRKLDAQKVSRIGRRLVLTDEHLNDLLEDRDRFANLLSDMNSGKPAPMIAGFKIYTYQANPFFFQDPNNSNKWTKKPYGAVVQQGDQEASVCFLETNVAKKTGITKPYFSPAEGDPTKQTNLMNYRHYFIALPVRLEYMGAIISGGTSILQLPYISSASPATGEIGDDIVLSGLNFTGVTAVHFGATAATSVNVDSDNGITVAVPAGLADGSYDITVTSPDGVSNIIVFEVTS